jgi:hypothetical protein
MQSASLLVVLTLVLGAAQAQAGFYQWTDRDGREFYTNDQEKIPPEYRKSARPVDVPEERVSVGQKPAAGRSKSAAVSEHKDRNGRGEEYWRKRAQKLRKQLREQQEDHDALRKQIAAAEAQSSAGMAKRSTASLKKKQADLEKKIARTKRELEVDLPEEARRADAYPGWLRE